MLVMFTKIVAPFISVRQADVSLLVLSLPDIIHDSPSGPTISTHITSLLEKSTYILLNKSDLVPPSTLKAVETVVRETFPDTPQWTASLANGEGTTDFLQRFATALQTRYEPATSRKRTQLLILFSPIAITS